MTTKPLVYPLQFNIHEGIDSTLMILQHRLKTNNKRPQIKVVKEYGDIPPGSCYPRQLNQVFINILANAIDALDEANRSVEELESRCSRTIPSLPSGSPWECSVTRQLPPVNEKSCLSSQEAEPQTARSQGDPRNEERGKIEMHPSQF